MRVVELFAGVGGFRLGLEGWNGTSSTSGYTEPFNSPYRVVWSNQWEPLTKKIQHASMVYEHRFGKEGHSNVDIATVEVENIPDHDMLVGGFPCQDYSVATTLKNARGLLGRKGVLWWSIHKILSEKRRKPSYLFLENVDRLINSPAKQRGRDFAIILQSLNDLGYAVEWRVVNSADYGMPQKRKRIFILGYRRNTPLFQQIGIRNAKDWILNQGVLSSALPVVQDSKVVERKLRLLGDVVEITSAFNKADKNLPSPFENSGIMKNGVVTTLKTISNFQGRPRTLGNILQNGEVTQDFYINTEDLGEWRYLKGSKNEIRVNANGQSYLYSEGSIPFPDSVDKPSRTIITGEGGSSPSRFKHVIQTERGLRRLSPVELERLNMFPDNHTQLEGITDIKRAFFMGNALVVGVIEKIGRALHEKIEILSNEPISQ
jgi:DNA (cytosine-5)-methyltransferase 1